MSATNATANYNLPLFIGTDKPAWLTDWNGAMNAIDSAIANVASSAGGTATDLAALTLTVSGLSSTVSDHTTSISTLTTAVSGNTGSINTINSLIGNGQPTTTDKTIIGAINELHAEIGGGSSVTAAAVSYNGTTSGLAADDVQEAIDELAAAIPTVTTPTAADVTYSNTASGLAASNVQAAIDELAQSSSGGFHVFTKNVTGVNATAWGNLYAASDNIDISSLRLQSAPTKVSVAFISNNNKTGMAFIGGSVSATSIEVGLASPAAQTGINGTFTLVIYD